MKKTTKPDQNVLIVFEAAPVKGFWVCTRCTLLVLDLKSNDFKIEMFLNGFT